MCREELPEYKEGKEIKDIPPNSPLGEMLQHWDTDKNLKKLDRIKMINYSVEIWPKEIIQEGSVYWPWYGSKEKWMCRALNRHTNLQENQNEEEILYAACWLEKEIWDKKIKSIQSVKRKGNR